MQFLIILVPLLSVALGLPVKDGAAEIGIDTRDNFLEQIIRNLIEDLRQIMITGSEDVPVLDPLKVDGISVNLDQIGIENSQVSVRSMVLKYLSTFEIDTLRVTLTSPLLQRYTVVLEGRIPLVDVDIDNYNMDVNVQGINIFGDGRANIKVIEPRISASLVVGPRISISGLFINVISCQISAHLDEFKPEITGMLGGDPDINDFINLFLENLIPELADYFEDEITEFLSDTILVIANEVLRDLDIGSILGRSEVEKIFDVTKLDDVNNAVNKS